MTKSFLGICGRRRSGKDTVARILSLHFDSLRVVHLASALKGLVFVDLGQSAAFVPYISDAARKELQMLGEYMFTHHPLGLDVWTSLVRVLADYVTESRIVVADVRMLHEERALRAWGGKILKIVSPPSSQEEIDKHKSEEEVDKVTADLEITQAELFSLLREGKVQVLVNRVAELMGWWDAILSPPRKPRIYISSNIQGVDDFISAFQSIQEQLKDDFEPINPVLTPQGGIKDYNFLLDAIRKSGVTAGSSSLVSLDLQALSKADGVLCVLNFPSIGVAMEVITAAFMGKPVVIACRNMELLFHPWLWAVSQGNVYYTLPAAIERLKELFGLGGARC